MGPSKDPVLDVPLDEVEGLSGEELRELERMGVRTALQLLALGPRAGFEGVVAGIRRMFEGEVVRAEDIGMFWGEPRRVPLDIPRLDAALGGGFLSGRSVEILGEAGSGMMQLSLQLLVNALSLAKGASAVYVDTVNSFRPEPVLEICSSKALDGRSILRRIFVLRALSLSDQLSSLSGIEKLASEREVGAIVVNSPISNFAFELGGKRLWAEKEGLFGYYLLRLKWISLDRNALLVLANPAGEGGGGASPGGRVMESTVEYRLLLRRWRGNLRRLLLLKPKVREITVALSRRGVEQVG